MEWHVGTSGYSYKEWKGRFYPSGMRESQMLGYYASQFPAVEINSSFYRIPARPTLEFWSTQVPAHFRFAFKAPQRITHVQRLRHAADVLDYFLNTLAVVGRRLGPILFQLGPGHRADCVALSEFLALLPGNMQCAFEFRNASWMNDAVFDALRARDAAFCIADTEERATEVVATASWGYLRLRRADYDDEALSAWMDRIRAFSWTHAWVFFKHEDEARGPAFASRFQALARTRASE